MRRRRSRQEAPTARRATEVVTVAHPRLPGHTERVEAVVSTIDRMHRAKQIDARQLEAARQYALAFERAGGSMGSLLDQDRVGTSAPFNRTPADAVLDARRKISGAEKLFRALFGREIGGEMGMVLEMIAGADMTLEQATASLCGIDEASGRPDRGHVKYVLGMFTTGCTKLAEKWIPERGTSRGRTHAIRAGGLVIGAAEQITPGVVAHADRRGVR